MSKQVHFHGWPQNAGRKHIDMLMTHTEDFEVSNCGVCMHTQSLSPSRSKGITNSVLAAGAAQCG